MDGLLGFLGVMREAAWVYVVAAFLVAAGLFFLDGRRKEAAPEETAQSDQEAA